MLRLATSPGADRLAVHTVMQAGEEIAVGAAGVTDRERAAAGRQTIAERRRELLGSNRKRAAEQMVAPALPDGEDVLRVWSPRSPVALRGRMGHSPLAVWCEGDVLHLLWRGEEDVHLAGGIQPQLWPVDGAHDLWEASLRIRHLQEAVITIIAFDPTADMPRPPAAALVWRGPRARAMRPRVTGHLEGSIEEHVLGTRLAGAGRPVTVYRPPPARTSEPLIGCILADGESTQAFAEVLEPAIANGLVPPLVLVGVHSAALLHTPGLPGDRRAQEYLPGRNRYRFDAHLDFVVKDVIPWATNKVAGAGRPWLAAGFSNGAAWAIAAAQRRPDLFKGVAAFSAGVVPRRITGRARAAGVRYYLAAGALEPGFRPATRQWAERLQRAGLACHHHEWVGGHDPVWWEDELPAALAWLLSGDASLESDTIAP